MELFENRTRSNVDSIFNCDLPHAKCTYYYPNNFFDDKCGIGRTFREEIIVNTKAKMNAGTLWNHMPSIGFPTIRVHSENSNSSITPLAGEHLSFIHVHKAGGSSLHYAFNRLSASRRAELTRHRWWSPGRLTNKSFAQQTRNDLKDAIAYPISLPFEENNHLIFAVVRNPVERFISSMGQAFGAVGSTGDVANQLSAKCIKDTSRETLRCTINHIKENGFYVELHFSPQVLDLSFTTMFEDVPIAIFPFHDLPNVLQYLGLEKDHKGRDGSQSNYRPHPVLTNMTVDDYDTDMMRDICTIYEVDVIMQRSMGIEVPQCDPFIIKN